MPDVTCPCGVRIHYTRTAGGWTEDWNGREATICLEIAAKIKEQGYLTGGEMNCVRLSGLIESEIGQ